MTSLLLDKVKQNSLICDAEKRGVLSGAIPFACRIFIERRKITPNAPKTESGLIQMIRMGMSIQHKWVKKEEFFLDEASLVLAILFSNH